MDQDQTFNIPEPPPGMGAGVLAELWHIDKPLPRIRGVSLWAYYLKRGFDNIVALPMSNTITIMTIAISLFLFAGFLLILQNIDRVISDAGSTLYVTAYLKEGAAEVQVNDFVRALENDPRVRSVSYVSKDEALANFRKQLGSHGGFLEGVEEDNPLPSSVDLILFPDELKISSIERTISTIDANPVVDDVIYGGEWVERMHRVLRIFHFFGYVALFIVLAVIVFLIANTIKLVVYARQEEIGIMQLVGATDGFVKIPFLIGGVMQGVVGSAIGLVFLRICFALLNYELKYSMVLGVAFPKLSFLGPFAIVAIVVLGSLIGAIGRFFALGRFMNV